MARLYALLLTLLTAPAFAQAPTQNPPISATTSPRLTVELIMQDPKMWVGTSPSGAFWAEDGKTLYFNWNPEKAKGDSLYKVMLAGDRKPQKVSPTERRSLPDDPGIYNRDRSLKIYDKNGDLFLVDCRTFLTRQLTNTVDREANPAFSGDEKAVVFQRGGNLFSMGLVNGDLTQYTNFDAGSKRPETKPNAQETSLKKEQLGLFDVLRDRKAKRDEAARVTKADQPKRAKLFYTEGRTLMNPQLSPDGKFVTFALMKAATGAKTTLVPSFVTESGFTEDLPARTKVGAPLASFELFVYDITRDTIQTVSLRNVPGIMDKINLTGAASASAGPTAKPDTSRRAAQRVVYVSSVVWSPEATNHYAVIVLRAQDNKDRWIMQLDPATRTLKLIDRQHDDAWIGGPNIGFANNPGTLGFLGDSQTIYFQSEADGYSHLYTINLATGERRQLTSGKFEVQQVTLSKSRQHFFLITNELHPGEQHLYRMAVTGGRNDGPPRERLTTMTGANDVTLSPDESTMLIRHSYSNKPWELYLSVSSQQLTATSKKQKAVSSPIAEPIRLTESQTTDFEAYPWREAQIVTIPARDGQTIYARLYKPEGAVNATGKANPGRAVVFVHGAGYLQNAHKWWSQYFREYMFHNLLVDKGYTVLDIDYRASAGYGRDWRTGIYRHMGGKDLTDHVDAAEWLVKNQGVDAKRIGIYGGSYGGYITLMAMFTTPGFAAGAALRPVTDWAADNHGYTASILNEPQTDSLAYHRSSPIYFADGLKGHLLICHGMVDVNVHYQDAVRLAQRLIELKKENWELASYPMEDHGFVEPSSWMDEYKRILKLFDERL
ncbi:MAG: prolyl oligopeptidase family serine peptidase [Rudanella sp.]|nr:prolyl oligopeptidase family serine peptidase [Rudanella sp.]